jgi:hypothetical protein
VPHRQNGLQNIARFCISNGRNRLTEQPEPLGESP